MFDWECEFLDDSDHGLNLRQLARSGVPILAIENTCDAEELFKYRPPNGRLAVIVGNERKGISRSVLRLADRVLRIPIASAHINTVNVAAAAAIAIFHLTRPRDGRIGASGRYRGRPEVLLTGVSDAIELGSAVRSAACFGWPRLFIDDRHAAPADDAHFGYSVGEFDAPLAHRQSDLARAVLFRSDIHPGARRDEADGTGQQNGKQTGHVTSGEDAKSTARKGTVIYDLSTIGTPRSRTLNSPLRLDQPPEKS